MVIYGRDKPAVKTQKKIAELMELQGFQEKDIKRAAKGSKTMKNLYDKKGNIKI